MFTTIGKYFRNADPQGGEGGNPADLDKQFEDFYVSLSPSADDASGGSPLAAFLPSGSPAAAAAPDGGSPAAAGSPAPTGDVVPKAEYDKVMTAYKQMEDLMKDMNEKIPWLSDPLVSSIVDWRKNGGTDVNQLFTSLSGGIPDFSKMGYAEQYEYYLRNVLAKEMSFDDTVVNGLLAKFKASDPTDQAEKVVSIRADLQKLSQDAANNVAQKIKQIPASKSTINVDDIVKKATSATEACVAKIDAMTKWKGLEVTDQDKALLKAAVKTSVIFNPRQEPEIDLTIDAYLFALKEKEYKKSLIKEGFTKKIETNTLVPGAPGMPGGGTGSPSGNGSDTYEEFKKSGQKLPV